MLSFSNFATLASLALSAFVAVSAAPLEARAPGPHVMVTLNAKVATVPGDSVWVTGSVPELKNWAAPPNAVALSSSKYTAQNPMWSVDVSLPTDTDIQLKYIVKKKDGTVSWEAGKNRVLHVRKSDGIATSVWNNMADVTVASTAPIKVDFSVAVRPASGDVYIVGDHPMFGNWNPAKGYLLDTRGTATSPLFKTRVTFKNAATIQYKFVVKDAAGRYLWESGANRQLNLQSGHYNVNALWRENPNTPNLSGPTPQDGGASIFFLSGAGTAVGEKIFVIGNIPQLGAWDVTKAVPLSSMGYTDANPTWWTYMNVPAGHVEYKFIKKSAGKVTWEGGANHVVEAKAGGQYRADSEWQN